MMEAIKNKAGCKLIQRSDSEILSILMDYEKVKNEISTAVFCKSRGVSCASFYVWKKLEKETKKYSSKSRFIEIDASSIPISDLPEAVVSESAPVPIFASIMVGDLSIQLHQYVDAAYIRTLLSK